ncbi:MAG: transcription elongation factor GreA [Clostridia bacterium]|nr:transcription elongation factor GreA [Clostridia bacterium]
MTQTVLTEEGKKQLEAKLEEYKTKKRPEVIKKIGLAREFGDLSENAEYDAAKEEQARIESEIQEMEAKLRNCIVIGEVDTSKVNLGCVVTVFDQDFNEEIEYKIVGSTESNPLKGLISNESPVGVALLGKKVGDMVAVQTPTACCHLKVVKISK